MANEIKILIASDIHLGIRNEHLKISDKIRLNTFKKIVNIARDYDFFLIAGDLFDREGLNSDSIKVINNEFKALRNCNTRILISPGVSETGENGELNPHFTGIEADYIFSKPGKPEIIDFTVENQHIIFYGMPASGDFDILSVKKIPEDGFHIGLFHAECDFRNIRFEISSKESGERIISGLGFYALGGKHNFKMYKVINNIIGIYPGSPEATDFNETGDRYIVSITVENHKISNLRRLCINSIIVNSLEIDCTNFLSGEEFLKDLSGKKSEREIVKMTLTGIRRFPIDDSLIQAGKSFFYDMHIIDGTLPSVELLISMHINENTIRGDFFRLLKDKLDKKNFPDDLNIDDLSLSLNALTGDAFDSMEDWLCDIASA